MAFVNFILDYVYGLIWQYKISTESALSFQWMPSQDIGLVYFNECHQLDVDS